MASIPQVPENKVQYLQQRLAEELTVGAKLAMCLDPENHLDGNNHVVDAKGRNFRLITYHENDLAFRLQFRAAFNQASSEDPLLIRVTLPLFAPLSHQISLSYIADIVSRLECGPIDLRTDAVVAHYTEPVVWPEKLQEHAFRIGQNLPVFVRGYRKMREAIGKKQTLAAYHISAALLLGSHPALRFDEMDLTAAYPPEIIARGIGLVARFNMNAEDRSLLAEVLLGTSRQGAESNIQTWLALPLAETASLLVATDFLTEYQIPNAIMLLSGIGLFSYPVADLRELAQKVIQCLKDRPDDWRTVSELVDSTLSEKQATDIIGLLRDIHPPEKWLELITNETPRSLALAMITGWLNQRLEIKASPDMVMPAAIPDWAEHRLNSWETPHHDSSCEERAVALLRLINYITMIHARLSAPSLPPDASLNDYLELYTGADDHRLELLLALASKQADAISDSNLISKVDKYLSDLGQKIANRLDGFDEAVAEIIRRNPKAYRGHQRNSSRFLKSAASRLRGPKQRLFVWLFDGMRWDTWVDVIRPVLEEGFRIEDQKPLFAPLPTYTGFARTSFFAGAYPDSWRGFKGKFIRNEGELAARNLGVRDQNQYEEDVVFVTQTDTAPGKAKFRNTQPRRFNFLVFNISDDNIHDEQGDLREVNEAIRMKVKNDVLPEMKRMVESGDLVVITSDHGFVQLRPDGEIPVSVLNPDKPEVRRRYAFNREELDGVTLEGSDKHGVNSTTCAIGRTWFSRDTSRGKNYTRYDHGGLSLSEIVVPGVIMHKSTEPESVKIEIITPEKLEAKEDEGLRVEVKIINKGTSLVTVRVTIGSKPSKTLELARDESKALSVEVEADLKLTFINVVVEHRGTNGRYAMVPGGTRQIPVKVNPRSDKVEFSDALDIFDDL
jgi:hypothetical protein